MSAERPRPEAAYGMTEHEKLFDRISDQRFRALIEDEETSVHKVEVSSNNYGEFLFVTTSRIVDDTRDYITFWGMGLHEYRERWFTDEWYWYTSYASPDTDEPKLTKEKVRKALKDRMNDIAPYITHEKPSQRAQLFSILADITDEDGAYSELEDLGDLSDLFDED